MDAEAARSSFFAVYPDQSGQVLEDTWQKTLLNKFTQTIA